MYSQKSKNTLSLLALFVVLVSFVTLQWSRTDWPLAYENVFERQAQTGGMVFLFCKMPERTPLNTPQQHFGTNPFQMEFSLFEWLQAKIVRSFTHGQCDLYEPIVQKISLLFALLAIVLIFYIGAYFGGAVLAVTISAFFAYERDWLKYSTYILTDPRTVFMVFLGFFTLLRGRDTSHWLKKSLYLFVSIGAFFLAGGARPQAYLLWFGFFGTLTILFDCSLIPKQESQRIQRSLTKSILSLWPMVIGGALALGYHMYASIYNAHRDLPWLIWAGPSIRKLYVADFHERFEWAFYKGLFLGWLHRTWLLLGIILISLLSLLHRNNSLFKKYIKYCILITLPFLIAQFLYQFTFLKVIKMHDYYAIPIGVISGLSKGIVVAYLFQTISSAELLAGRVVLGSVPILNGLKWCVSVAVVLFLSITGLRDYQMARQRVESGAERFHPDLNPRRSIFPSDSEMVVIAHGPAWGSSPLSIQQKVGFLWCAKNQTHAPRRFWQEQGVQYVAWSLESPEQLTLYSDLALPRIALDAVKNIARDSDIYKNGYVIFEDDKKSVTWLVRPISVELAYAKRRGYSSDIDDHWAGQSIFEWAHMASRLGYSVCDGVHDDPRRWDVASAGRSP